MTSSFTPPLDSNEFKIRILTDQSSMEDRFPLIQQLNPTMTFERYASLLTEILKLKNYFQVAVFHEKQCIGLTGIWMGTQIWCGKFLEVDNFVVDEKWRGKGIGNLIMEWVEKKAQDEKCEMIRLDTYVTLEGAQRFYFSKGFKILGFHMIKKIEV